MVTEHAGELPTAPENRESTEIAASAGDTLSTDNWWRRHGRIFVLFGAFALPLFCASPWFEIPLQYRLRSQTMVGVAFQVTRIMPALMTANGFVLWLAWRSGWQPTRRRRVRMYAISAAALFLLPVVCAWSQLVSGMWVTEGWRESLRISCQLFGPAQMALFGVSELCRALLALVGLRLVAWIWNVALVEPCHTAERRRARFTIAGVLATTAVIAVLTATLQVLFRQLPFSDHPELGAAMVTDVVQRTLNVVLGVITTTLIARIGWPTLDVMIPRVGVVVAIVIAIFYGAMHLQTWLPYQTYQSTNFTLLEIIPYPIALVLGIVLVVAILRSLGLHLRWDNYQPSATQGPLKANDPKS